MEDNEVRLLRSQMKLLQRRLRREARPVYGVSRTASQVLAAVVRLPAAPQPRQIAEELQMTSSNVAAALRELETAGCVLRRRDSTDARRVSVFLTEHGQSVVTTVRNERDTWLGLAMETLLEPEEQRLLIAAGSLMRRLADFEPPSPDPRAGEAAGRSVGDNAS